MEACFWFISSCIFLLSCSKASFLLYKCRLKILIVYIYVCACVYVDLIFHLVCWELQLVHVQDNYHETNMWFFILFQIYPPKDWLVGSSLPSNFSPNIIQMVLDQLSPDNFRLVYYFLMKLQTCGSESWVIICFLPHFPFRGWTFFP